MFYQFKFCCGREEENEEAIAKPEKANKNNTIITFYPKSQTHTIQLHNLLATIITAWYAKRNLSTNFHNTWIEKHEHFKNCSTNYYNQSKIYVLPLKY